MASFDRPPSTTSIQSPRRQSIAYQLNNIMNMWHFLPQGHEKHLKQAFYNTLANVFIIFTALAAVGVYYILAPFVQPLYWAVLCGTFLYPFKWRLTNILRGWLTGLQKSGTPFAVGLVVLPVQISNNFAYVMTQTIWNYKKALVALVLGLPMTYCLYHFAPANTIYNFSFGLLVSLNGFVDYFNSNWVIALFVGYMLCVVFLWTPETTWMSYVAAPVWVALFLMIANVAGPLRVPLFLLLVVVIIVGIIKEVLPEEDGNEASQQEANSASQGSEKEVLPAEETTATVESGPTIEKPSAETDDSSSLSEQTSESPAAVGLAKQGQSKSATASVGRQPDNQEAASIEPKADFSKPKHQTQPGESKSSPSVLDKPGSLPLTKGSHRTHHRESSAAVALNQLKTSQVNSYFTLLFLGHFIVRIWMHLWIVALLLLIPLLHYCARLLVRQFQKDGIFYDQAESAKASCSRWMEARKSALMPQCLRGAGAFLMKGDQQMISVLEKGLDQATSILFILMLLVGTLLFSIIGAVQIQRETVYMASVTQKIFNETMNSNEFSEWMPKADEIKVNMDRFLKNSHQQGRNLIASRVIDFMPKDSTQEEKDNLVNQILEIWDKLYDTVLASLAEEPKTPKKSSVTGAEGDADPSNLYDSLGSTMNNVSGMLHMSAAVEFVKQNLGMFMSVLESVFTVMKSNMTLILTVVTFVFSAILGGGTAILNFVISSIIFLTTLFYLLSSSGDVYKPVEIFKSIPGSTGSSFATAVEQAISGVFTASLKMAAFYGLYTWLVHLVFGLEIVFIPSALAAVFAAVPFLGPYWAAVPAVIELWLVQGRGLSALALFLAHMLPSSVVDTRIYSEIEGGHPYVTGLAIAGGIMFMGLQGAIIGPIILCFFIVVFKMYGSLLSPDNVPPTPQREGDPRLRSVLARHQSVI